MTCGLKLTKSLGLGGYDNKWRGLKNFGGFIWIIGHLVTSTSASSYYFIAPPLFLGQGPNALYYSIQHGLFNNVYQEQGFPLFPFNANTVNVPAETRHNLLTPRQQAPPAPPPPPPPSPPPPPPTRKPPMLQYNKNIIKILNSKQEKEVEVTRSQLPKVQSEDEVNDLFISRFKTTIKRYTNHLIETNEKEGDSGLLEAESTGVQTLAQIPPIEENPNNVEQIEMSPIFLPAMAIPTKSLGDAEAFLNLSSIIDALRDQSTENVTTSEEVKGQANDIEPESDVSEELESSTIDSATETQVTEEVESTTEGVAEDEENLILDEAETEPSENEISPEEILPISESEEEGDDTSSSEPEDTTGSPENVTSDLDLNLNLTIAPSAELLTRESSKLLQMVSGSLTPNSQSVMTPEHRDWWTDIVKMAVDSNSTYQQIFVINIGKVKINLSNSSEVVSIWKQLIPTGEGFKSKHPIGTNPLILLTERVEGPGPTTPKMGEAEIVQTEKPTGSPVPAPSSPSSLIFDRIPFTPKLEVAIDPRSIEVTMRPINTRRPNTKFDA